MQRFRVAEAAVLPWIVLSQTVPLIALAPLVRRWGSQIHFGEFTWESWMSVALIASYLAFFPVSVGALRGLGSPDANHVDLMHCYAVGWAENALTAAPAGERRHHLRHLAAHNAVIGTVKSPRCRSGSQHRPPDRQMCRAAAVGRGPGTSSDLRDNRRRFVGLILANRFPQKRWR
jgi:hypothetical protein